MSWFVATIAKGNASKILTSDGGAIDTGHPGVAERIANEINLRTAKIYELEAELTKLKEAHHLVDEFKRVYKITCS